MTEGGCVGKLPQEIIGDQRLPSRVVINERLDMLLQKIGADRHVSLLPLALCLVCWVPDT